MNTQSIPTAIALYVAASNNKDINSFIKAFTNDAVVHDEGKTYIRTDAILAWKEDLQNTFDLKYELHGLSELEDGKIKALIQCEGNFTGSPIVFTNYFVLKDSKIDELEIHG